MDVHHSEIKSSILGFTMKSKVSRIHNVGLSKETSYDFSFSDLTRKLSSFASLRIVEAKSNKLHQRKFKKS